MHKFEAHAASVGGSGTELLTAAEMRRADELTVVGGMPGFDLMRRAGQAVAKSAARLLAGTPRIVVLCGSGNNGGDGFVAAKSLRDQGLDVVVACSAPRERLSGDAAQAFSAWGGPVAGLEDVTFGEHDLVIDALLGAGLTRNLDGAIRQIVETLNRRSGPVLAVDVPTGLDADTGQARGAAVRATGTVTFARHKPGHLLLPGRDLCGEVELADIGIPDEAIREAWGGLSANAPSLWRGRFPVLGREAHKYERGHALVVSGGPLSTGAARLAARAALRTGAGLVTVASPRDALATNAAHLTAVMVRPCDGADELRDLLEDRRFAAVVMGPGLGLGPTIPRIVAAALEAGRATVLDADALTAFAGNARGLVAAIGRCSGSVVVTPHAGEFSRLFAGDEEVLQEPSKVERARRAAARLGCVVVLKGADTVIAAPDGAAAINENAGPELATAGSGDVLAGIVGGLGAQGMPAYEAACAGVWIHGAAGALFGTGLIAEDLPEQIPAVLRGLR